MISNKTANAVLGGHKPDVLYFSEFPLALMEIMMYNVPSK